jgi:signal peptidase I
MPPEAAAATPLQTPQATRTRPLLAAILSLFCPGLGQLYAGAYKQAVLFAGFVLILRLSTGNLAAISYTGLVLAVALGLALLVVSAWDAHGRARSAPFDPTPASMRFLRGLIFAVGLYALIQAERFFSRSQAFVTPAESMRPTLRLGDQFIVDRWAYGSRAPGRGEIVAFRYPKDPSVLFVKRVIGLPGDRIAFSGGDLLINGKIIVPVAAEPGAKGEKLVEFTEAIDESVPHRIARNRESQGFSPDIAEVTVPEASYYVLGDNRDFSNDSRFWGFVPRENLIGRAVYVWANFTTFDFAPRTLE